MASGGQRSFGVVHDGNSLGFKVCDGFDVVDFDYLIGSADLWSHRPSRLSWQRRSRWSASSWAINQGETRSFTASGGHTSANAVPCVHTLTTTFQAGHLADGHTAHDVPPLNGRENEDGSLELEPSASKTVRFVVPINLLAYTGASGELIMEPGPVEMSVGSSSSDTRSSATLTVTGQARKSSGTSTLSSLRLQLT